MEIRRRLFMPPVCDGGGAILQNLAGLAGSVTRAVQINSLWPGTIMPRHVELRMGNWQQELGPLNRLAFGARAGLFSFPRPVVQESSSRNPPARPDN
jgi:hypothetical protein